MLHAGALIWEKEQMPEEWIESLICPAHKKKKYILSENYSKEELLPVAARRSRSTIARELPEKVKGMTKIINVKKPKYLVIV